MYCYVIYHVVMLYNMCHVMLCYITYVNMSCHVLLYNMCHAMLYNMSCHVMLPNMCHAMLCYITYGMSCYAI